MRKYLKTVDFINTKYIMFNITPFLPTRILPTNTTTYDLENQGQGQYSLMAFENYGINH